MPVRRVHRFVPVSAAPCTPRVQPRWDRVRSELAQGFRLRDPFVQGAVRVRPRDARDSVTFPVA